MAGIDAWTEFWGRQSPASPALLCDTGVLSWGELSERVRRVAAGLRAAGIGPGDAVEPPPARSGVSVIELLLGCARLGAVIDLAGGAADVPLPHDRPDPDPRHSGPAMGAPLLRVPGDLDPDRAVTLTHHDVEALAVAGIAADGLWPADRVAASGTLVERLVAALPALHAGAAVMAEPPPAGTVPAGVTVLYGPAPESPAPDPPAPESAPSESRSSAPASGSELRRIVVREVAPPAVVAGWAERGVEVVLAYGPVEASGFGLREPRAGAPLVALPGRRARIVDGELWLAGAGVVAAGGWLRTGRRAARDAAGFLLSELVGS